MKKQSPKRLGTYILLGVGILSLAVYWFATANEDKILPPAGGEGNRVVMTVGEEKIYKKDLQYEMDHYPQSLLNASTETELKKKMQEDSIILQAARDEGLIKLDDSIFNSTTKSYENRVATVTSVRTQLEEKFGNVKGGVVTIWFYNTEPAKVGIVRGKQIAFQKISELQKLVKSNTISIQEAAERVRRDTSLINLDKAYVANAYIEFDSDLTKGLTFDPEFDKKLAALGEGGVSDVHLASHIMEPDKPAREMAYMFGTVFKKSAGISFEEWLQPYQQKYEVHI